MLLAATQTGTHPDRISFSVSRRLIIRYSLIMTSAPTASLPYLYKKMIEEISKAYVKYRPGRLEPRAVRREKKHYESLKIKGSS
jgi:hypothetical protein